MGSLSALPALDVKTPQPEDILQKYGNLLALRNQQQQGQLAQQEAPLRLQALQQGNDTGAIDLQQKQQALKDQQATTTAMQQWDGKDINDLYPLVLKNGGSSTAVIGLKSKVVEQQKAISDTFKNNMEGAKAQVDATKTKGDQIAGALTPFTDPTKVPDDQLTQALQSAVQGLVDNKTLDPQHAQAALQLVQQAGGDPTKIRTGVDQFIKTNLALSQVQEAAYKEAQTASEKSTTAKNTAESSYYAQNGGAPGVSPDTRELNSYLQNNPGKTAQDFAAWKAKQAPLAQLAVINATGVGRDAGDVAKQFGMSPTSFDQTAEKYWTTGTLPPVGRGGAGMALNKALMNRAAELHPDGSLAANSAEYKASSDSLKKLQGSYDTVTAFENTANKNITMLEGLAQKVPDLGARFANIPVRMLSGSMIGSENMAAFKTALAPVQAESAKILNSANLQGQLSDSSRHELQNIVDGNLPYPALAASLKVLQQDFENRKSSTQEQINDIKKRLGDKSVASSSGSTSGQPTVGDTKKFPNGKIGKWDGTGWVAQ